MEGSGRCHQVVHYTESANIERLKVSERTVLSYVGNTDRLCRILSYNLDDHRLLMLRHGSPDVVCTTGRLIETLGGPTTWCHGVGTGLT